MALGTHSVFEGVALGLQTKADKVLEFAVAILVHEWVMAFIFGLEVHSSLLESSFFPLLSSIINFLVFKFSCGNTYSENN